MSEAVAGKLHVANDVLADMVGHVVGECYGIVGVAAPADAEGIARILPAARRRKGIVISTTEAGVHVDVYVVMEYGCNISAVSQNLIDQISYTLKEYARVPLDGIDVHLQDIKVR